MAALWMAGWLSLMMVMVVAGRETTRELNVFELIEVRSVIAFFLLLPFIYRNGGFATLKTVRLAQHIVRNLIHYSAQLGWFFALTLIPIGQVVAIEFTMPIWTAILAAAFLGERITAWRAIAIMLGVIGVVTIVRPATGEVNPGQLIALAAAVGFGISMTLVKSLTRTESALAVIFWMTVVQFFAGFIPTFYVWVWPSAYAWGWLIVIAVCGTLSHYLPGERDALRRRQHRSADGFPAGSPDRDRRLAALCGAAGPADRARGRADPGRQSLESEAERAGSRPRWNLSPQPGSPKVVPRICDLNHARHTGELMIVRPGRQGAAKPSTARASAHFFVAQHGRFSCRLTCKCFGLFFLIPGDFRCAT